MKVGSSLDRVDIDLNLSMSTLAESWLFWKYYCDYRRRSVGKGISYGHHWTNVLSTAGFSEG